MKYLTLILILTSVVVFSEIREDLSGNTPLVVKKLYAKGSLIFGPGFEEKILVGKGYYEDEDKDPQDIYISPGGGTGPEAVIGYDISKLLSFEFAIGLQNSGRYLKKDNFMQFKKSVLRASILYRIPIEKYYTPYIGAGISTNPSVEYVQKDPDVNDEIKYQNPVGFHLIGGAEIKAPQSPLYLFSELKLIILGEYTVEKATSFGSSYPTSDVVSDFRDLSANGLQFSFGLGYYLK